MNALELVGYIAALFSIATYSMKTMIPLRTMAIVSNVLFLTYGYFGGLYPTVLVNSVLLPLNSVRLYQMVQLVKKVKAASMRDGSMDWLKPFMDKRRCRAGEIIFQKGSQADQMFYTLTGKYRLRELDVEISPGQLIGELGLLSPGHRRTQTFECVEAGDLLTINYDQVRQLYFQNPKFAFYFLQLASHRLFENIQRLEGEAGQDATIGRSPTDAGFRSGGNPGHPG